MNHGIVCSKIVVDLVLSPLSGSSSHQDRIIKKITEVVVVDNVVNYSLGASP